MAETSRSRPRPGAPGTTARRAAEAVAGGGELPDRVLEGLERATTQLPASVPTQSVRAIRQGQLVKVINEAVAPERARMEAEQARWRTRVAELEGELLALRDARRRMEQAKDATRTVELPRLAALVDAERTKGEQLAQEREAMRARVAELEQAVVQREERLKETSAAEAALRMALDALHEPASGVAGPRAGEEADARVRELGERLETLSAAVRRGALPAASARAAVGGGVGDPTAVAELARASDERARRIATLERAVAELGGALVAAEKGGEGAGASAAALAATLELLREAQAREGRLEAHVAALIETQQLAQAALAEEGRRRAGLEESLHAALARLSSLEAAAHARVTRSYARGGASQPVAALGPGLLEQLDDLRESLSLETRRRADEVEGQVGRLGQATRAALERMAAVLDRALAAGLVGSPPDLVARSVSAVEAASRREPRPRSRPEAEPEARPAPPGPEPKGASPATRTARPWRAAEEGETREWREGPGSPSASSASQARLRPNQPARHDAPEPAPRLDGSSTRLPILLDASSRSHVDPAPAHPAVRLARLVDDRPTTANPAPALPLPPPAPAPGVREHVTEIAEPADFLDELVDDEPERPIPAEVESWFRPGRPGQSPSEVEAEQLAEFGRPPAAAAAQAWLDDEGDDGDPDDGPDQDDTGLEGEDDVHDAPRASDRPSGSFERPEVDDAEAALWRELGGGPPES